MIVEIKYFGKIADVTQLSDEQIDLKSEVNIGDFLSDLVKKYPDLKKEEFKIALNQEFVEADFLIEKNCEIALLPPFAGG